MATAFGLLVCAAGRERELVAREGVRVQFFEYDWTLNDVHADRGAPVR